MVNNIPSIKAQDRPVSEWFNKIESGEIKLPRFQRHQAWDHRRIQSLMNTIIHNLPLGVTLILNIGNEEPFVSRYLETAPHTLKRVNEHLLDGQQRLTSLWRALHNNYPWHKYFVYFGKYDKFEINPNMDEISVECHTRWTNNKGLRMPLWADSPFQTFSRGLIPCELFVPGDVSKSIDIWVTEAIALFEPKEEEENYKLKIKEWTSLSSKIISDIRDIRETITHYNLPYLALPASTAKDTALQVFINMNTNSKPLSQYDIIRAEIEGVKGESLDDLQNKLNFEVSEAHYYSDLPFLILATSALIQDKLPNQKGMWDMRKDVMVDNWDVMTKGIKEMVSFLEDEGIFDERRLPTNAVLAVISALFTIIPEKLDAKGVAITLLRKYMWSAFFTDRYENSAATHAYNDYSALKKILLNTQKDNGSNYTEDDVPIFNRTKHPLSTPEELTRVGWPKGENIRARAIMAIFSKLGAVDFADGSLLNRDQLINGKRHYHHIFPDHLLAGISGVEPFLALNCALITDKTNLNIKAKAPIDYLKERYDWIDESIVNDRLKSHLIPIKELSNGEYNGLTEQAKGEKLKSDYETFIAKRALYVSYAAQKLTTGFSITAPEIINEVESKIP